MKTMTSKFPGWCRKCRQSFPAGTEINWSPETKAEHAAPCTSITVADPGTVNFALMQTLDKVQKANQAKLVPGVYEVGEAVYVVKPTREDKTRLYAKRMVVVGNGVVRATEGGDRVRAIEFEYERGAIYNIRLSDRMPVERAKELITLYGCCIACGRHLKAAKSVEQGIGPVCIKNFGPVLDEVEVTTADGREIVRAA